MTSFRSISAQLAASYIALMTIGAVVGIVGFLGARSIAEQVGTAADVALPRVAQASALESQALRFQVRAASFLATEGTADEPILDADDLRDGWTALVPDVKARDEAELTRLYADATGHLNSALLLHESLAGSRFVMDGERFDLPGLVDRIKLLNAQYLEQVQAAALSGNFEGVLTDSEQTLFARWSSGFVTNDATLAARIEDYAQREAATVEFVRTRLAARPSWAPSRVVMMQTEFLPSLDLALAELRKAVVEQQRAQIAAKTEATEALIDVLGAFAGRASTLLEQDLRFMEDSVVRADATAQRVGLRTLGAVAVAAVLALMFSHLALRRVARPLVRVNAAIKALAEGQLDDPVPHQGRRDEIGSIAMATEGFRLRLLAANRQSASAEAEREAQARVTRTLGDKLRLLAEGDMTASIEEPFPATYEALRIDFNDALRTLGSALTSLTGRAHGVGARALEIDKATDDLSRRTESQAATLEQAAAALDELTNGVQQAARTAAEANTVAGQARTTATTSTGIVRDTVSAMSEIEASSGEIIQIVSLIDDIAFQTNLLALNAGVEAARAGEAGRGFSVVASEVQALALRTAASANDIKTLIHKTAADIETGSTMVARTGEALNRVVSQVSEISTLVEQIAAGSADQARGLQDINSGVTQLDHVTQQNAAMVNQTRDTATSLMEDASALRAAVLHFRLSEAASTEQIARMDLAS